MAFMNRKTLFALVILAISYTAKCDEDSELGLEDSKTDQILNDTGDIIEDTDVQNYERLDNVEKEVTEVPLTTAAVPDFNDSKEVYENTTTVDVSEATEEYTLSMTDNYVYKHRDDAEDYSGHNDEKVCINIDIDVTRFVG